MNTIEAVILSGGQSRRMGADKASLLVDGEPILDRIKRLLTAEGIPSTVLGPQGKADEQPGSGPLFALAGFIPAQPFVFVCSCDLPLLDGHLPAAFLNRLDTHDAVIPVIEGRHQPLCALYRSSCFALLPNLTVQGERRIFSWLDQLDYLAFDATQLAAQGIHPKSPLGANTPEAWNALLESRLS